MATYMNEVRLHFFQIGTDTVETTLRVLFTVSAVHLYYQFTERFKTRPYFLTSDQNNLKTSLQELNNHIKSESSTQLINTQYMYSVAFVSKSILM